MISDDAKEISATIVVFVGIPLAVIALSIALFTIRFFQVAYELSN